MEAIIRTKQIVKPTHVTLVMTYDEAMLLLPFLGKIDLNVVNRAMNWGTHSILYNPLSCSCGKSWPCEDNNKYRNTNEAIFEMFCALDISLRKYDTNESS